MSLARTPCTRVKGASGCTSKPQGGSSVLSNKSLRPKSFLVPFFLTSSRSRHRGDYYSIIKLRSEKKIVVATLQKPLRRPQSVSIFKVRCDHDVAPFIIQLTCSIYVVNLIIIRNIIIQLLQFNRGKGLMVNILLKLLNE